MRISKDRIGRQSRFNALLQLLIFLVLQQLSAYPDKSAKYRLPWLQMPLQLSTRLCCFLDGWYSKLMRQLLRASTDLLSRFYPEIIKLWKKENIYQTFRFISSSTWKYREV